MQRVTLALFFNGSGASGQQVYVQGLAWSLNCIQKSYSRIGNFTSLFCGLELMDTSTKQNVSRNTWWTSEDKL